MTTKVMYCCDQPGCDFITSDKNDALAHMAKHYGIQIDELHQWKKLYEKYNAYVDPDAPTEDRWKIGKDILAAQNELIEFERSHFDPEYQGYQALMDAIEGKQPTDWTLMRPNFI